MFPHPHNLSDGQLGLLIVIILPVVSGLGMLYRLYRVGKLRGKPTRPVNPLKAYIVILLGILLMSMLLALVGCSKNEKLSYDEVAFERMEEMLAESCEGVSAAAEGTPQTITIELQNDLEHEIIFWGWSNPYILRNGTWYRISRTNPVDSTGPAKELSPEQIENKTVFPGENKAFTLAFFDTYGAELEDGDYRICATFELDDGEQSDPNRVLARGNVWAEFTIP